MPPCDSISVTTVVFGPNTDPKLIHAALQELGLRPVQSGSYIQFSTGNYNTKTNQFTFSGAAGQGHAAEIKQAYSAAVVKAQAKRYGWQLKETGKFKYAVTKRTI